MGVDGLASPLKRAVARPSRSPRTISLFRSLADLEIAGKVQARPAARNQCSFSRFADLRSIIDRGVWPLRIFSWAVKVPSSSLGARLLYAGESARKGSGGGEMGA
jgi:hypothetical protein